MQKYNMSLVAKSPQIRSDHSLLLCSIHVDIDECAAGAHHCGHIDDCIDTEGSHECLHESNITSTTTSHSADVPITTTPISTDHPLPSTTSTPVQVDVLITSTIPPDTTPISVHAFCSNKHAGVKWMVHESNVNCDVLDPETIDTVDIKFQCQTPEGNVVIKLVAVMTFQE